MAVVAAALGMLFWSWGTWPHPYVDFGRELYVPWRLSEGEVLYRDLAWFNGPLSPYWNAGLFGLFGTHLMTLVSVNLVTTTLLTVLLYALLVRVGDRLSATFACLVFVTLFAFSQFDPIGNDNYLTPYSHEVTHGLGLSLLAIALYAWKGRDAPWGRFGCGLLLGMVALTKSELFLAAFAALGTALFLDARARRQSGEPPARGPKGLQPAFWLGLLLPVSLAFGGLALAMPAEQALRGTLGSWPALLFSDVASQPFYQATRGTLFWQANLIHMLVWSLFWAIALGLPVGAAFLFPEREASSPPAGAPGGLADWITPRRASVFGLGVVAALLGGSLAQLNWPDALRPLPLLMVVLAVAALRKRLAGGQDETKENSDPTLHLALLIFAGLLLAKVALRVRFDQYGFALAMPAALLGVVAILHALPRWVSARGGDGRLARAGALGVLLAVTVSLLPLSGARFSLRDQPLGRGGDAFLTDVRAGVFEAAIGALARRPVEDTLAVLPEGVMLNYLARRENPTGHINFMPPEMIIFGEAAILADFRENPPSLIALTHKDTREYGVGFFGEGYGRQLYAWVRRNYEPVELFGDPPLQARSRFGIQLLTLRDSERAP